MRNNTARSINNSLPAGLSSNSAIDLLKALSLGASQHALASSISVAKALMAEQLVTVQAIASQFHPSNTYNCDESGLLWKITPDRGQATQAIASSKLEKARITVHFCCNADGSHKLPPWFIGKHRKPRAFGAANININSLGCY
jgi:hypothetical protein